MSHSLMKKIFGVRGKWRARNEYLCLKTKCIGQESCCEDPGSVLASDLRGNSCAQIGPSYRGFLCRSHKSVTYKKMLVGTVFKSASEMVEKFGNPCQRASLGEVMEENHE